MTQYSLSRLIRIGQDLVERPAGRDPEQTAPVEFSDASNFSVAFVFSV